MSVFYHWKADRRPVEPGHDIERVRRDLAEVNGHLVCVSEQLAVGKTVGKLSVDRITDAYLHRGTRPSLAEMGCEALLSEFSEFLEFQRQGGNPTLRLGQGKPDWEMLVYAGRALRHLPSDELQPRLAQWLLANTGDEDAWFAAGTFLWSYYRGSVRPSDELLGMLLRASKTLDESTEGTASTRSVVLMALSPGWQRLKDLGIESPLLVQIDEVLQATMSEEERGRLASLEK